MGKHRYPATTRPNISRSRSRWTRRQRRINAIKAEDRRAYETAMARIQAWLAEFDTRKQTLLDKFDDITTYDEKEEAVFHEELTMIKAENDNKTERRRNRLSKTARGRQQLAREDAKIEGWANRLANDVADLTD